MRFSRQVSSSKLQDRGRLGLLNGLSKSTHVEKQKSDPRKLHSSRMELIVTIESSACISKGG
jgi:hypothetical protein